MPFPPDFWRSRRHDREKIGARGARAVWGHSPSHSDVAQGKRIPRKGEIGLSSEEISVYEKVGYVTSGTRHKSMEAKRPRKEDKELRDKETKKVKGEDSLVIGPQIPEHLLRHSNSPTYEGNLDAQDKKNMLRGEAAAMAAYAAQGKRIPRRGEIGLSSEEISVYEKVGYAMSGTRHKSMEAKRPRKEDKELRDIQAKKVKGEDSLVIGPQIPEHLLRHSNSPTYEGNLDAQDKKNMLRGEAAAMAAYAAQGKRIPRRGEIGLSSEEISVYEKVGYVMSGTRHKSMEATRLRKENQILTAEEKRLLNTFSQEERKKREETVLKQFQELISSKKSKS